MDLSLAIKLYSSLQQALSKQKFGPSLLGSLVELLRILCNDSLQAYLEFQSAHPEVFSAESHSSSTKISADDVLHSMRLLSLCSMGAQEKNLSYEKIASALNV
jgi:hypothetical protein